MKHLALLFVAIGIMLAFCASAPASGLEVNGVIQTQPVSPGNYMNPAFTGKIDINIHSPTPANASTGLMVVLHGFGSNYHRYDTECETWVNDYNVFTVQVNYRGTNTAPPGYDLGKYQAVDVLRVVHYMLSTYAINKKRIFLWGASGGGNVALHTAKMAPDTFAMVAALAPITRPTTNDDRTKRHYESDPPGGWETFVLGAGRTYTTEEWDIRDAQYLAAYLKSVPVYLLHGSADPVVDWQHSKDMDTALQAAGGRVSLITITGGDHEFKGALDPTENTRFKATQKYLRALFKSVTSAGRLEEDHQAKVTFPTRGTKAWPVKFDVQGLATLNRVAKPGAVVSLGMNGRTVKQGGNLAFGLKIENWSGSQQSDVILAGFLQLSTSTVIPLLGPSPFLLPAGGVDGPVSLPITKAFPPGEYLFVTIVLGSSPSAYIDLDYFQFTVAAG